MFVSVSRLTAYYGYPRATADMDNWIALHTP